MPLQAYIDDSTDKNGLLVLAGYVATSEAWAKFSEEWEAMLPQASVQPDGRYRFKMSEMAQSPERMSRVPFFQNIINRHVLLSLSVVVDVPGVARAMSRVEVMGRLVIYEGWSPFMFAYRALMDMFHNHRDEVPELADNAEPIDFCFDETTEKSRVLSSWEDYLASRPEEVRQLYGAQPRFADDEKCLPLQAADHRAWWVRTWAKEHGMLSVDRGTYPFPIQDRPIGNIYMAFDEEHAIAFFVEAIRALDPEAVVRVRDN